MGTAGVGFGKFWGHFGFFEAFRLPGDEEKWPRGKALVPQSEWTVDRMAPGALPVHGVGVLISGARWTRWWRRPIRKYFCWNFDQGMIPMDVMKDQLRTFGEKIMPHYR